MQRKKVGIEHLARILQMAADEQIRDSADTRSLIGRILVIKGDGDRDLSAAILRKVSELSCLLDRQPDFERAARELIGSADADPVHEEILQSHL